MVRKILHCDLNNFFASVECLLQPNLKGKCIAVCGNPLDRHGIVLAKSIEAKPFGLRAGEPVWEAKQKCPNLLVVEPHYDAYVDYSRKVREIYSRYTDLVESFGMDECWLDVTANKNYLDILQISDEIRNAVRVETGLTISVGASYNKIYAKLGSDMKKPDATTVITMENHKQLVYPLKVNELLMIGNKTAQALDRLNIHTIGELAQADDKMLSQIFGIVGAQMKKNAAGLDDSPVVNNGFSHALKSVGHGTTTKSDVTDYTIARQVIYTLSDMVASRLKNYEMSANLVSLNLRFNNLDHSIRQTSLPLTTNSAKVIADTAYRLLNQLWTPSKDLPIRTITVTTSKLVDSSQPVQTTLFDEKIQKMERIESVMDGARQKFGKSTIKRATIMENAPGGERYISVDNFFVSKN